jgi:drug/metabolite transporter (DMT)-like permease
MTTRTISPINIILMLFVITVWGSSFVIVRTPLNQGLTPTAIATFRFLTATPMFLTALAANKTLNRKYRLSIDKKDVPRLFILAFSGVTFFFIAQYTGIQMADSSIAAIMVCLLSPIFITTLSSMLLKEKLTRTQTLGIPIAAIGTLTIIVGGSMQLENSPHFLLGTLILLTTPILWTTYTLSGKTMMQKYNPFLITAYASILGGLCLIPFSIAEGSFNKLLTMNTQSWMAILFLALTCSLIGYTIWFYVTSKTRAAVVSSFLFAEPLITVLFATRFAQEPLSPFTAIGGLLIFAGMYIVSRK